MSFDSELDYTKTVEYVTVKITALQLQVTEYTAKITQLQISPYVNIPSTVAEIVRLQTVIDMNNLAISNYQSLLIEIARIQALSAEEKALIYYYYTILGVSKLSYMIKMLFNTDMLTDVNVLTLYNDTITPPEVKLMVAKLIYDAIAVNTFTEIYNLIITY